MNIHPALGCVRNELVDCTGQNTMPHVIASISRCGSRMGMIPAHIALSQHMALSLIHI